MSSDVDLVVLTESPDLYVESDEWLPDFGSPSLVRTQQWGVLTERRVRLGSGLEVEFGFAHPAWAALTPLDAGTRGVVTDGLQPLYDPARLLAAVVAVCATRPSTDIPQEAVRVIPGSRLFAVTLDCPDPHALAYFYREIIGGELQSSDDDFVVLSGTDGTVPLGFQRVQNSEPAPWPDPAAARRLHLDFVVNDLAEAEAHLCSMGARRAELQLGGDHFRVLIDPAGHPFCLAISQAASTPSDQADDVDSSKRGV